MFWWVQLCAVTQFTKLEDNRASDRRGKYRNKHLHSLAFLDNEIAGACSTHGEMRNE
jgi:hypothetical protein